uniref:RNA pseudouridylate synthase domain-containing protein 2-like n=1 Tax=Styela clava TaxID=7725 RepID=UPI00193A53B7|nr:RNA pseudouridylate synthase domain-containing protein 2-like [Styela clava]
MKFFSREIFRQSRKLLEFNIPREKEYRRSPFRLWASLIKTRNLSQINRPRFRTFHIRTMSSGVASTVQKDDENSLQTEHSDINDKQLNIPDNNLEAKKDDQASATSSKNTDISKTKPKYENARKRKAKRSASQKQLHMTYKRQKVTMEDAMTETKYYFENGFRKVVPYDHKYDTFCKGRWEGKSLREIYTSEFRLHPVQFYEKSIEEKRLMVNLEPIESLDHVLKSNDLLTSVVHRHECPVTDAKFEIILEDSEWFVINKPCSIPIHPAGRFRYNSIISILAKEYNMKKLFSIHRIDRMTSGLLLFAKTQQLAHKLHDQFKQRKVQKEYVCHVVGDFSKFKLPPKNDHRIKVENNIVTISEPIKLFDPKIGTSVVSRGSQAKECVTDIECLHTDGKTSLLSCKPKTGRTHQIRVHLQYLGYPISNDQIYNSPAWGDERFTLGPINKNLGDVKTELSERKKWLVLMSSVHKTMAEDEKLKSGRKNPAKNDKDPTTASLIQQKKFEDEGFVPYKADCEECIYPLPDPSPENMVMFLHAYKYKGPNWSFETKLPEWAASRLQGKTK